MKISTRRLRGKADTLRIVVTGLVGLHPVGGVAWDYLQYVLGLARLGHDVYYHEDTWSWPYDPVLRRHVHSAAYSVNFITNFFRTHAPEMERRWHYVHLHETHHGMSASTFDTILRTADLYIDVSGASFIPEELSSRCTKLFIDTDPGYNQIVLSERPEWSENVGRWAEAVYRYDRHFTYAENIYAPDCLVPHVGLDWKTTRAPIVLDCWNSLNQIEDTQRLPWSTVMTWNAFKGRLRYRNVEYYSKGAEFSRLLGLPRGAPGPFKVALGGKGAPVAELERAGWETVDGPSATRSSNNYRQFIAGSRGEISTAKQVYVAMRTGWFSCRSACYLAAGRPAVVQDTGFSAYLPTGEGLLTFDSLEEALEAIAVVDAEPQHHRKAAREFSEVYLDSDKVLTRLIEDT